MVKLKLKGYKGKDKELLDLNIGQIIVEEQDQGSYYSGYILGKDMNKVYGMMEDDCEDGTYCHFRDVEELDDHVYFVQFFQ